METINDVIEKRNSFQFVWQLLAPQGEYNNKELWTACRNYWNSLTLVRQRQIYYTLRWMKFRGERIKDNPLFAIQDCVPVPTNWNGNPGLNELMKTKPMVSAKYHDRYGIYYAIEAKIFEMTDVKPLN